MIIREFEGLDTSDRKRIFAECICSVCSTKYVRQKRQLNEHNTCSSRCTRIAKGTTVECICDHCGELFLRAKTKSISKSGKLFCSRICKDTAQTYMLEIQPVHYGSSETNYRDQALKVYKPICKICGYSNILALEVHHIDKNRSNNNITNLEVLCANCHTIKHRGQ